MIELTRGDLLRADAEALVNTVNCAGHMGRGLALQFKRAFPACFAAYAAACKRGEVQPGRMHIIETGQLTKPRYIVNFPTKRHWKNKSLIEDIDAGLAALIADVQRLGITSIAVPPLGCGLGGLDWADVRPRIERAFASLPVVRVLLYEPASEPEANQLRFNHGARMPSIQHLRPADYRVMPWKNGLGTTTEIAVHPPGAGLDEFTWRLSIADLTASGPFSTFAGYDRVLVQIEGAPMTLSHAGRGEHRLRLLSPYRFAGELETYGALEAPPARDFNVMVRRDRASAEVSAHELAAGEAARAQGEAEVRIVHALRGVASVEVGDTSITLRAGETLVATGAPGLAVSTGPEGATVIVVAIGAPGRPQS